MGSELEISIASNVQSGTDKFGHIARINSDDRNQVWFGALLQFSLVDPQACYVFFGPYEYDL